MKKQLGKGYVSLLFFAVSFMLLLSSPALYAYQEVGGGANCQACHEEYALGTAWHTDHQTVKADNDCTACHSDASGGGAVMTSKCSVCHSPGEQPCEWVNEHEEEPEAQGLCIACHPTCVSDGDGDEDPCPTVEILGAGDPRLNTIRKFRDDVLTKSAAGRKAIKLYYQNSAAVTKLIEANPKLKESLKQVLEAVIPAIETIVGDSK